MNVETMTPDEMHEEVGRMFRMESDVRNAARSGEPLPEWVADLDPTERALAKLYYHHERDYCAPRMRGEAPF